MTVKMKNKFIIINFLFSHTLFAQSIGGVKGESILVEKAKKQEVIDELFLKRLKEEYKIDYKFEAGRILIYDCQDKHWTCINEPSLEKCMDKRNYEIEQGAVKYSCAPLRTYETKEECIKANYRFSSIPMMKRFCYPPEK